MNRFNAFVCAGAAVILASCSGKNSESNNTASEAEQTVVVSVAEVYMENVPQTGMYTSTVMPYIKNNIAPQTVARIDKINVEVGDFVKEGQIVAEMDDNSLLQTKLKMVNDSTEYSRLVGLYEAGGLSKSDLDAMELAYNVSKSSYENLLENTILRSPVDGVITARNYDRGDMFSMGQPIYTVEQITPVKLLVGISEVDYTKVKKGDVVEIVADAFPERTFKGTVNRIYPTIDPLTHTFPVEIIVKNADRVLRPGMFARVKVQFGVNNSTIIPDVALVKQVGSGDRFVYVLNPDSTVEYRKVNVGIRMNDRYEILSGLKEGEKVVTKGQVRLKAGMKVSVSDK